MTKDVRKPVAKSLRPLWLLRRWKAAAGPLAGLYVPAAPFTALALFGEPQRARRERTNPAQLDGITQGLAERLAQTEQAQAVRDGQAAFVVDLPGALSAGLGCYLQAAGIAPVLAWGGLFRPGALLEGVEGLAALGRYGAQLRPWQNETGLAFLLERERTGPDPLDDLTLSRTFDNRYHAGEYLLPPLATLKASGLTALIDLRAASDELPDDLNEFYRAAALAGLNIYQAALPLDWFTDY